MNQDQSRRFEVIRDRVRDFFLLDAAARASAALPDDRRAAVRAQVVAVQSRWQVARNLTEPAHRSVALSLYAQAVRGLGLAQLEGAGVVSPDEARTTGDPAALLRQMESLWQTQGIAPPLAWARVMPLLGSTDPHAGDQLSRTEAADRIDDMEVVARFVAGRMELRSPREIAIVRRLRQLGAGACALALVVAAGVALLSPRNLAQGKTATSSSVALDTTPAGAVDGSTSGLFGFHSGLEEAPWLAIDLGAAHAIDRIVVYGRGDAHNSQSIPLALETSGDGIAYTSIAVRTEPFSAASPWVLSFKDAPLKARYVRLRAQLRTYLVLGEVEVFGRKLK
jgi:hypothetical protein